MDKKEHEIISKLQHGSKIVFRELFERYYLSLCKYANTLVDNPIEAEDIVQDIFFNLWEKRKSLNIEHSLSAYLYRTVYYQSLKILRKKSIEGANIEDLKIKMKEAEIFYKHYESPFSKLDHKILKLAIKNAIENLPEKTKEVFILSRKKNLKNREIAEFLNISIKTVEYHITKALEIVKDKLNEMK